MTSPHKRRNMDIMKLMMSDYRVDMGEDDGSEFYVDFSGPSDSAYEGGEWKVHVELPAEYPFRSPSIGFKNRMYHPNVDLRSGTICLDVINQTWSPMYDLVNVFEVFLPQLLHYPNPADPLNSEAATLLLENPEKYKQTVRQYVQLYAKKPGELASASGVLKSSNQGSQTSSENATIASSVNCGSESGLSKVVGSVNVSLPGCGSNNVNLGNASSFPTSHSNGNVIMQAKEIEIEWQNGGNGDMRSLSFDDGDDRITFDMEI